MSDRPAPDRAAEGWISARLREALMTSGGRARLVIVAAILALLVAIGGHIYGRFLAARDIQERDATILQLQAASQKLEAEIADQNGRLAAAQTKLTNVQAALDTMMPTEDTFKIDPNQSLIVAGGHLTIGLIGAPTNQGVNININGKQQSAAAGDVIRVAPDPSTNCQVRVQSFDMFKVIITASCAAVNPE